MNLPKKSVDSSFKIPLLSGFLPTQQTRYQPLDQGIIYTWKSYWKQQWILHMMAQFDQELDPMSTITILDAINWAVSPWDIDLSTETICNCFKRLFLLMILLKIKHCIIKG